MGFEIIDISGDVGIRAYGSKLEEVFIDAAKGLYSLITDPGCIKKEKTLDFEIRSNDIESLLVNFLNEIIFHFDTYGFVGSEVHIESNIKDLDTSDRDLWLRAVIRGEDFDPERHEKRLLIKAATYHNLRFYKDNNMWNVNVIFDI